MLTDFEEQKKGKLFLGKLVFESFCKSKNNMHGDTKVHHETGVIFIYNKYLEDNQIITFDPVIIEILKELENELS